MRDVYPQHELSSACYVMIHMAVQCCRDVNPLHSSILNLLLDTW